MGRGSSRAVAEKIMGVLTDKPKGMTVQDVSKETGVSWDSTKRHLELFTSIGVLRETVQDGKSAYQKVRVFNADTLFSIPLREEHKIIIKKIYATIQSLWKTISSTALSKTLVQKIAVDVVEKQYPEIPRAWYLYGEILLLPFDMEQEYGLVLEKKEDINEVKSVCQEYAECCETSYQIRRHQYQKRHKELYLLKDNLLYQLSYFDYADELNKHKIRQTINEFATHCERKERNAVILAIVDDLCSAILSVFRNADDSSIQNSKPAILEAFSFVWQLVATYEFYDSLSQGFSEVYDKELLWEYLSEKIQVLQQDSMEALENIQEFAATVNPLNQEVRTKLSQLMGSSRELTIEEKKKREVEQQKMTSSDIFGKFGFDNV